MCAENMGEQTSEIFFLLRPEDAINEVKRNGYILMPNEELPGFDMDELYRLTRQERYKTNYELIYDPNRIEIKTVNTERGLKPEDTERGWKEIGRTGEYAKLIREKK